MDRRPKFSLLAGAVLLLFVAAVLGARSCARDPARPATAATKPAGTDAVGAATTGAPAAIDATGGPSLRMQSLVFALDAAGLHLREAATLTGRAKAPPRSTAPDRLEFVAFDAAGHPVHSGSLDHPLHRRFEVESATEPGRLESVQTAVPADLIHLRLPDSPRAVRVQFFEVRAGRPGRTPLGEVSLP